MTSSPKWVFDCSVTMAWCFDDERTPETDELMDRLGAGADALVPQIWPLEVGNVLTLAMRKGRITAAKMRQFISVLELSPITLDVLTVSRAWREVIELAQTHRLTTYDASYLELAMRTRASFATLDKNLRQAASRVGLSVLPR